MKMSVCDNTTTNAKAWTASEEMEQENGEGPLSSPSFIASSSQYHPPITSLQPLSVGIHGDDIRNSLSSTQGFIPTESQTAAAAALPNQYHHHRRFRRKSRMPPVASNSESYRYKYYQSQALEHFEQEQQQEGMDDDDHNASDAIIMNNDRGDDDDNHASHFEMVSIADDGAASPFHWREQHGQNVAASKKKKRTTILKTKKASTFSNPWTKNHRLSSLSSPATAAVSKQHGSMNARVPNATAVMSSTTTTTTMSSSSSSNSSCSSTNNTSTSSNIILAPVNASQPRKTTVIPNPLYPPPPAAFLANNTSAAATSTITYAPSLRSRRYRNSLSSSSSLRAITDPNNTSKTCVRNRNLSSRHAPRGTIHREEEEEDEDEDNAIAASFLRPITMTVPDDPHPYPISNTSHPGGNGLRTSLDAGMAAVRRWIQSKAVPSSASAADDDTSRRLPRHAAATTTLPEEEEKEDVANRDSIEQKQPPIRSTTTSSISAQEMENEVEGDNNDDEEEEDDDWLSCVDHQEDAEHDDDDVQSRLLHLKDHDVMFSTRDKRHSIIDSTIELRDASLLLEEGDEQALHHNHNRRREHDCVRDLDNTAVGSSTTNTEDSNCHRQRALSEPNGLSLRDDIFQRALQGGFRRRGQRSRHVIGNSEHPYSYHHAVGSDDATQYKAGNHGAASSNLSARAPNRFVSMPNTSSTTRTSIFHTNTVSVSTEMAPSQRSTFFSDNHDVYNTTYSLASAASVTGRSVEMTPIVNSNSSTLIDHPLSSNNAASSAPHEETNLQPSSTLPGGAIDGTPDQETAPEGSTNAAEDLDPNRASRLRWIRINRRFQLIITVVALIFSLLLFGILVCWVVLTSAYVVSIDKICDVPLKPYFWLVTLQLILDVFRSDIMRLVCRWDANSRERIPCRVITYNIIYLTYALLVLRLGIRSVYVRNGGMCRHTAPELFQSSAAFVTLSIAAWSTIVLGYLVPFCFVATLLTWNGYTPASDADRQGRMMGGGFGGVFPSTSGAPPECIDQMRVVLLDEFRNDFPRECCICIGDFVAGDVIVATSCNHVFHKQCCREWLRQARTCPVCRADIPSTLPTTALDSNGQEHANNNNNPSGSVDANRTSSMSSPPRNPGANGLGRSFARQGLHHEVVSLLRFLRQHEDRLRSQQRQQNRSNVSSLPPHMSSNQSGISSSSLVEANDESQGSLRLELPTAPSSAPVSSLRYENVVPPSRSDGDLASMEEGRSTSSSGSHHQHSM
jgi:hypothetical protein